MGTFEYARDWDALEMDMAKFIGIDKVALKLYSIEEFVDLWDKLLDYNSKKPVNLESPEQQDI